VIILAETGSDDDHHWSSSGGTVQTNNKNRSRWVRGSWVRRGDETPSWHHSLIQVLRQPTLGVYQ